MIGSHSMVFMTFPRSSRRHPLCESALEQHLELGLPSKDARLDGLDGNRELGGDLLAAQPVELEDDGIPEELLEPLEGLAQVEVHLASLGVAKGRIGRNGLRD